MSHIITQQEQLKKISEHLNLLRKNRSKYTIYTILHDLIPKNEEYQVFGFIGDSKYAGCFKPSDKKIIISEEKLPIFVNRNVNEIISKYPNLENQKNELICYETLFVLFHEIEHVYQYLIGNEYIEFPYQIVIDGYKNLFNVKYENDIFKKILLLRYINQINKPTFVLERNANVEAYDLLLALAEYEENKNIKRYIENQKLYYLFMGYNLFNNGSFEQSYKKIWKHKEFQLFNLHEEISIMEKIRYGLPVDKESKKIILK